MNNDQHHPFQVTKETDEYTQLLTELHSDYCNEQPSDVLQFCANFFIQKLEAQRAAFRHTNLHQQTEERLQRPTNTLFNNDSSSNDLHPLSAQCSFTDEYPANGNPFQWNQDTQMTNTTAEDEEREEEEEEDDFEEDDKFSTAPLPSLPPVNYNRGRRTSVSAESMAPSSHKEFVKVVIPKSEEQMERIKKSISNNFLFRNLDEDQYMDVVHAMSEKRVPKDVRIIEQGDVGDYFYVVESGTLDCYIGDNKVTNYEAGGSFGELALMYNAPRAASITTTSNCVLWALDRITFRTILMENTSRKRRMYEDFLSDVGLLKSLESYEKHKIADALESVYFEDGQEVVKQGDVGDQFYIIESGEAVVLKTENGEQQQVNKLERGSYFGELALLNDVPRAATVVAHGRLKCATLGKKAFTRLLGPVLDILKRNSENYHAVINQQTVSA
ncbi:camp-dependent protein kinase regulatory subunit [Mycotypha africana]|uniref:camp-dependent protein kinase regulatory subunit n=1 Tax=Mycotypha africana TaxID=64632 RepID=UPI002300AFFF|nr:camp-dependent protein kinase regulatory subunit [Mycotypha africana]KAI8977406.1 camp-dependent protein kinase regulatory subunit [Mycotypha africana]